MLNIKEIFNDLETTYVMVNIICATCVNEIKMLNIKVNLNNL